MAPSEIQVYASFPRVVELGVGLNLHPSNWHWVHCLTLPVETLSALQFSQRQYKWIRYAIGVVVGAEGDLSSSPDALNCRGLQRAGPPSRGVHRALLPH